MRVLIAPTEERFQQASEQDDFRYVADGELLVPPVVVCGGDQEVRDRCGCGRAMTGIQSCKGTTLLQVAEMPFKEVQRLIAASPLVKSWANGDENEEASFAADQYATVLRIGYMIREGEWVPGDLLRVRNDDDGNVSLWRVKS